MRLTRLGMSAAEEIRQLERLRAWGTAPVSVRQHDEALRERSIHALGEAIREGQKERRAHLIRRQVSRTLGGVAAMAALGLFGLWIPAKDEGNLASQGSPAPFQPSDVEARLLGTGTLSEPGRHAMPVTTPTAIRPGGKVQAGPSGAQVETETTKVVIKPLAVVALAELTPLAEEWTIDRGSAHFSVNPERHKHVTVVTDDTRVEVVGTEFSVNAEVLETSPSLPRDVSTSVTVQKGRVTVRHGGHVYTLNAGDRWDNEGKPSASSKSSLKRAQGSVRTQRGAVTVKVSEPGTTLVQENRLFHEALILRNSGQRTEALRAFAGFIARFPNSALRANAEQEIQRLRIGN